MNASLRAGSGLLDGGDCRRIFEGLDVGCWVTEVPKPGLSDAEPRLYADARFLRLMGATPDMTPEALYRHWFDRIDPFSAEGVGEIRLRLMSGRAQEADGRFLWHHPTRGRIAVRLIARLERDSDGIARFSGFSREVTGRCELSIPEALRSRIYNEERLAAHAAEFIRFCDDLCEIDPVTFTLHPISTGGDAESPSRLIADGDNFHDANARFCHPEDIEVICGLIDRTMNAPDGAVQHCTFRTTSATGGWRMVEVRAARVETAGGPRVLAAFSREDRSGANGAGNEAVLSAFAQMLAGVVEFNLEAGTARVHRPDGRPPLLVRAGEIPIAEYVDTICNGIRRESEREAFRQFLDPKRLANLLAAGFDSDRQTLEITLVTADETLEHLRIKLLKLPARPGMIHAAFTAAEGVSRLNAAGAHSVCTYCDHIYYVDLVNEDCVRFYAHPTASMPGEDLPTVGYAEQIRRLSHRLAEADRVRVLEAVRPEALIARLDAEGRVRIEFGMDEEGSAPRRKELLIEYSDRANRIAVIRRNDITEEYRRSRAESKAPRRALPDGHADPLTGLLSREAGARLSESALADGGINALLYVDIDGFDRINETFGRRTGDDLLRRFGELLRGSVRSTDVTMRLEDDAFAVLLRAVTGRSGARACAEHLRQLVAGLDFGSGAAAVSVSIGAAMAPEDGENFEALVEKARRACEAVKLTGRNGLAFSR